MKKFILLILIISIFISGCAKKDNYTHITFATWGSKSEIATITSLINKFEKENLSLKVDLLHIPDNYFQKLHLLIASNLSPDVIFINNLNAKKYIKANKFEPLNTYLIESELLYEKDFIEKALLPLSDDGKIYAIPRDISNIAIYYNKDLFDKTGINYPKDNWTMHEFLQTAQKLTIDENNDGKIDIFGFGFEKNPIFWLPFLTSNNGGILDANATNSIIAEKNSTDSIQFYSDLRNKYHVAPKDDEQSSLTTSQLFLQQKVTMHLCGRWCSQTYKKNANFRWGIVRFPKGTNGSIVPFDASGWAISSSSQHKKEAWKFIEFMSSDEASSLMTKDGLVFPVKKKIAYSKDFIDEHNSKAFIDSIDKGMPTPVCVKYSEVTDLLREKTDTIFSGNEKTGKIIDINVQNRIEKICGIKKL